MAHLRNCTLCSTEYDYCPRCDETQPTYLLKYCGENCKEISLILNKVNFKHLTKEQAADKFDKLDLSKLDKFNDKAKTAVKDILNSKKPVVTEIEADVEPESEGLLYSDLERVPVRRARRNK